MNSVVGIVKRNFLIVKYFSITILVPNVKKVPKIFEKENIFGNICNSILAAFTKQSVPVCHETSTSFALTNFLLLSEHNYCN